MAKLQKYFIEFNDKIKLSYEDSEPLREKREIILNIYQLMVIMI